MIKSTTLSIENVSVNKDGLFVHFPCGGVEKLQTMLDNYLPNKRHKLDIILGGKVAMKNLTITKPGKYGSIEIGLNRMTVKDVFNFLAVRSEKLGRERVLVIRDDMYSVVEWDQRMIAEKTIDRVEFWDDGKGTTNEEFYRSKVAEVDWEHMLVKFTSFVGESAKSIDITNPTFNDGKSVRSYITTFLHGALWTKGERESTNGTHPVVTELFVDKHRGVFVRAEGKPEPFRQFVKANKVFQLNGNIHNLHNHVSDDTATKPTNGWLVEKFLDDELGAFNVDYLHDFPDVSCVVKRYFDAKVVGNEELATFELEYAKGILERPMTIYKTFDDDSEGLFAIVDFMKFVTFDLENMTLENMRSFSKACEDLKQEYTNDTKETFEGRFGNELKGSPQRGTIYQKYSGVRAVKVDGVFLHKTYGPVVNCADQEFQMLNTIYDCDIPFLEWWNRLWEVKGDRPIYVMCNELLAFVSSNDAGCALRTMLKFQHYPSFHKGVRLEEWPQKIFIQKDEPIESLGEYYPIYKEKKKMFRKLPWMDVHHAKHLELVSK